MINGVSLFSNVGIGELYLKQNNINIKVANELLKERANFYKHIYPECEVIEGDITDKDIFEKICKKSIENNCKFVLATPPCQGMSIAGKKNKNDNRNTLITSIGDFCDKVNPDYILIENVPSMLKTYITVEGETILISDYINKKFKDYYINYKIIDAADYEVPQHRKRVIYLISKNHFWDFPEKHEKHITVREAIGHLPSLESGETSDIKFHNAKKHNDNHILWMKHTPTGKSAYENYDKKINNYYPQKIDGKVITGFRTTYKRMSWDKPAPTITMCNGAISSQNNVHPGNLLENGTYSDARVLTILEIMLLTGIPDTWNIPAWANDNLIRKVIGESVPPKLIEHLIKNINKE